MNNIVKLSSIRDSSKKELIVFQIKEIFYLSSSIKEFSSQERKVAFFKRWCGDYIEYFSDQFYIMTNGDKVLGYLSSCRNSHEAALRLEIPGFNEFLDHFREFPAHFHINCHPDSRGLGIGGQLVEKLCDDLMLQHIEGVHLVTGPEALNVNFYRRLGFNIEIEKDFKQMKLLFMGRKLS